jgi:hydrogenase expression/formation protein HypE
LCQTGTPFGRALGLDPLALLASGALLAVVDPHDVPPALEALRSSGAGSQVIGRVAPAAEGVTMATMEGTMPLPAFARDEPARWLEG